MGSLVVAVICGIVPSETAFCGFSDPAVITVAAVLILSQSLQRSRTINVLAGSIGKLPNNPMIQIGALTLTVAVLSAFINNVGSLALILPAAIRAAQASNIPTSRLLKPIAFGSSSACLTPIGHQSNLLVWDRADTGSAPTGG